MTSAPAITPHFSNGTLEHVRANMVNRAHLSAVLQRAKIERHQFDPSNPTHRAAYLAFMRSGKWVMHFHGQWPYQSVVTMVQDKLLKYFLEDEVTEKAVVMMLASKRIASNDSSFDPSVNDAA